MSHAFELSSIRMINCLKRRGTNPQAVLEQYKRECDANIPLHLFAIAETTQTPEPGSLLVSSHTRMNSMMMINEITGS